jgi:hypothetical protein
MSNIRDMTEGPIVGDLVYVFHQLRRAKLGEPTPRVDCPKPRHYYWRNLGYEFRKFFKETFNE